LAEPTGQGTAFHVIPQRPSPFSPRSRSPALHSGQRSLTSAVTAVLPIGLAPDPLPVPWYCTHMPHVDEPRYCGSLIATVTIPDANPGVGSREHAPPDEYLP